MKTAVSIPDDLFAEADEAAAQLELSRSAFYAKALRETLQRLKDEAFIEQMNAALAEIPVEPDPFVRRAAYLMAKRAKDAGDDW